MADASPRWALPFIIPGQAQKELYHNEALTRIDIALGAAAEVVPQAAPPPLPQPGQSWLVAAAAASGAWAGKENMIASWSAGGWRFVGTQAGMQVWIKSAGYWIHWTGSGWSGGELPATSIRIGGQRVVGERQPDVPSPSGGTIIDAEARAAIAALTATLKSHGLIE
jgi:Protein of unknown function (DUF2793)